MKKIVGLPVLFCIFLLTTAGTCCNEDPVATAAVDAAPLISSLKNETYKISYFFDDNANKTSLFSGYTFTFGPNNVLTAYKEATGYAGSWSVQQSNVVDDNPKNDLDFSIVFTGPDQLAVLSTHWEVYERTATRVILREANAAATGMTYVTFEKNSIL